MSDFHPWSEDEQATYNLVVLDPFQASPFAEVPEHTESSGLSILERSSHLTKTGIEQPAQFRDADGSWVLIILYGDVIPVTATTAVTFADTGVRHVDWSRTVNDVCGFADAAPESEIDVRIILDAIVFAHLVTGTATTGRTTVVFADSGTFTVAWSRTLEDSVIFVDAGTYSGGNSTFNLTILDAIAFLDRANRQYLISVSEEVAFEDHTGRVYTASITDSMTFTDAVLRGPTLTINDLVHFVNTSVAEHIIRPFDSDAFSFSDHAGWSVVRNAVVNDTIHFSDFGFVGNGSACDNYPNSLGINSIFRLQYPVVNPSTTLDLRVPNYGNKRSYNVSTKTKRTVDAFPRITRKDTWPKIELLHYTFMPLTQAQRDGFMTFFDLTGGALIKIIDQDNIAWQGVIVDPKIVTSQEGIGCQFKLTFTFRGTKL